MLDKLWIILVPFIFGALGSWIFLKIRSVAKQPGFVDGFLSWILFLITAFFGELLAHIIYPGAYKGIGDNPAQVGGIMFAILFSFITVPAVYMSFRVRKK